MVSYRSTIFETKAVVIKHIPLGEADRLVTFFSEKFGKVRAIARGVRTVSYTHLTLPTKA